MHTLPYPNGNCLAYAEYGNPRGFPILIQHGMIASIQGAGLFQRLMGLGTRLICAARPGYGASSPYAMSNIAEWGEIVSALVDELGLAQFDVLGMSSGAPYSYAIAHRFPHKARNIFIFSGTPALYDDEILAAWPYPVNKAARLDELEKLAYELFFSGCSTEDLASDDVRDSMMNNCFGIALDLKLRCVDWGFLLSTLQANVFMRHSRYDGSVPLITAEMTSRLLPHCRLEIKESDVHFSDDALDDFICTVMAEHYMD